MIRAIAMFRLLFSRRHGTWDLVCQCRPSEDARPSPIIRIVNSANNALAVTTIEPQLNWPIVLRRSDTEQYAAAPVQIDLTHLMSVSGRPQKVTLQDRDGAPHDGKLILPARGQETLRVVAEVPEEGAYKGDRHRGRRQAHADRFQGDTHGARSRRHWRNRRRPGSNDARAGSVLAGGDPAQRQCGRAAQCHGRACQSHCALGTAVALELRNGNTPVPPTAPISLDPLGQATLNLIGKLTEEAPQW